MNTKKRDRGAVLVTVMYLSMAFLIIGAVLLQLIVNQTRLTKHVVRRAKVISACQAGVNYAMWLIRDSNNGEDLSPWSADPDYPLSKEIYTELRDIPWDSMGTTKPVTIEIIRANAEHENKEIRVTASYN